MSTGKAQPPSAGKVFSLGNVIFNNLRSEHILSRVNVAKIPAAVDFRENGERDETEGAQGTISDNVNDENGRQGNSTDEHIRGIPHVTVPIAPTIPSIMPMVVSVGRATGLLSNVLAPFIPNF
jgi:hypothetical protein